MDVTNNNNPLFFVFTCVKNGKQYIDKLFESMLTQTSINFIHYIYEDGSSIPLGDKVIDYKEKVSKLNKPYDVIYEYNPINLGLIKSTQHCISKCTCKYFIWIDCDNYVNSSFFEEMEKLYKKHKNSLMLRSFMYEVQLNSAKLTCAWHKYKIANKKYQLGIYIRKRFFYSFFAVNYKKYQLINPNNIMINERFFYNDEQVILMCLLNCKRAPVTKKAISYFLIHDGQESNLYKIDGDERRHYHLLLCEQIDHSLKIKLEAFYRIKDLYDELFKIYQHNFARSREIIKTIKKLSIKHNIPLKNFYDYNLLKQSLRIYYWGVKNRWKS